MSYHRFRPYVPVAQRQAKALKEARKALKAGTVLSPVHVEGRKIAKTVWGQAWCDNLESYSDYENRLPRGRTYVRNGSVIDLAVEPGKVRAQVMGSSLYRIEITVAPAAKERWSRLVAGVTGSIASLVELLQGRLSKGVMEKICHPDSGLFPSPREIAFSCSCPDWASMCKHVAAALYGVGARLDASPDLLFALRNVSASDLIAEAAKVPSGTKKSPSKGRALAAEGLDELFGIDLEEEVEETPALPRPKAGRPAKEDRPRPSKKTPLSQKSAEGSSLPGKKRETAKKSPPGTKAATRSVGKESPVARPARDKAPSRSSGKKETSDAKKAKVAEKKTGTPMKKVSAHSGTSPQKASPASATRHSAPETPVKARRGRPPGKSSTIRKSPAGKKTSPLKNQGDPR